MVRITGVPVASSRAQSWAQPSRLCCANRSTRASTRSKGARRPSSSALLMIAAGRSATATSSGRWARSSIEPDSSSPGILAECARDRPGSLRPASVCRSPAASGRCRTGTMPPGTMPRGRKSATPARWRRRGRCRRGPRRGRAAGCRRLGHPDRVAAVAGVGRIDDGEGSGRDRRRRRDRRRVLHRARRVRSGRCPRRRAGTGFVARYRRDQRLVWVYAFAAEGGTVVVADMAALGDGRDRRRRLVRRDAGAVAPATTR